MVPAPADSPLPDLDTPLDAGRWYGDPIDPADALALWQAEPVGPLREPGSGHDLRPWRRLILAFWRGRGVEAAYDTLRASLRENPYDRALAELVYGELLMSRRLWPAHQRLQAGLHGLAPQLEATVYLRLVQRHEALAPLPLTRQGRAPKGLEALLREAAVIRRLHGTAAAAPGATRRDPGDTVG